MQDVTFNRLDTPSNEPCLCRRGQHTFDMKYYSDVFAEWRTTPLCEHCYDVWRESIPAILKQWERRRISLEQSPQRRTSRRRATEDTTAQIETKPVFGTAQPTTRRKAKVP